MAKPENSKAICKAITQKRGEHIFLSPEKLHLSEFNTRSSCIDTPHVDYLAAQITEQGFDPDRPLSVNIIRGAGGAEIIRRVAAGVHRFEAAKKVGLTDIPCRIYYDLSDEEECFLDTWDNRKDEAHKQAHFLDEAEHYRHLNEVKGWSYRKIGSNKNVDHKEAERKIKIAKIPEEAKKIIRGVDPGPHFYEKYFRDICKLSDPHIIAICKEIVEKRRQAKEWEKDRKGPMITPMKQSEIKKRVNELLAKENRGKVLTTVCQPVPQQMHLFDNEVTEVDYIERTIEVDMNVPRNAPEPSPALVELEPIPELAEGATYQSIEKNSRGRNLHRTELWLDLTGLVRELGQTCFMLLERMVHYDFYYRAGKDEPFFLGEGVDPFERLALQTGVEKEHIQKRCLPFLKREGFIDYWAENGTWWFKLNWNRLYEVYTKKAYAIPFKNGGLQNIPADFSGVIRPTPFHYLKIEQGQVVTWNGTANEQVAKAQEKECDPLAQELRCLKPPMGEKEILECCSEKRPETETVLQLLNEMKPAQRSALRSEAAFVMGLIKRGPCLPPGFVTPQEAREKEETEQALSVFMKQFREGKFTRFRPKKDTEYELLTVDSHGFVIEKEDGLSAYCYFNDWMNLKFFG
jgi:ParB-like chromosome segregation protein Spo0J